MPVDALVSRGALPEPAVLAVLHRLQEVLADLSAEWPGELDSAGAGRSRGEQRAHGDQQWCGGSWSE